MPVFTSVSWLKYTLFSWQILFGLGFSYNLNIFFSQKIENSTLKCFWLNILGYTNYPLILLDHAQFSKDILQVVILHIIALTGCSYIRQNDKNSMLTPDIGPSCWRFRPGIFIWAKHFWRRCDLLFNRQVAPVVPHFCLLFTCSVFSSLHL